MSKSTKPETQFVKIPLEGRPDEQLDIIETVSHVLINKAHIVSVQFNMIDASLIVTTTTFAGNGMTKYQWEQATLVTKHPTSKQLALKPDPNNLIEKSYDILSIEPASIIVTDRKAIKEIWDLVYPGDVFTGFDEHEKLVNKISQLRSEKEKEREEKAKIASLGLVKEDGSPLTAESVDKPTILTIDGEGAE